MSIDPPVPAIPVATVPDVKVWLQGAILANVTREPGYGLVVCLDDPGPQKPEDIIAVTHVHRKTEVYQMVGTMGAGSILETYDLHVLVSVFRGGPDQSWPYRRAWSLAGIVESVVRSDPTCGGFVIQAHPRDSSDTSLWEPGRKGRVVEVEIIIQVMAQI
ncbi:hypothetical protein ACFVUS_12530 [Nocardia sp. NPDC058058]|uniref:hypothetical protein n=1 Tax=Nocardia sp. NPDC058058 TaxID=3346317 RepID=UPI0036DEE492